LSAGLWKEEQVEIFNQVFSKESGQLKVYNARPVPFIA